MVFSIELPKAFFIYQYYHLVARIIYLRIFYQVLTTYLHQLIKMKVKLIFQVLYKYNLLFFLIYKIIKYHLMLKAKDFDKYFMVFLIYFFIIFWIYFHSLMQQTSVSMFNLLIDSLPFYLLNCISYILLYK